MNEPVNVYHLTPIGVVHSPFQEKFGIPRQPGLAKVDAVIELLPPFALSDAVSGIEQFSHIWITFIFHAITEREWKALVRPPRLGGNEKVGVFATRSPNRPNPIGLSVVELLRVDIDNGVKLHIRGADLLDGTPVLDIKPYVSYVDSIPNARAGFAQNAPQRIPVRWNAEALVVAQNTSDELQNIIEEILSFDPRPAYQDEPERIYGVCIADTNVRFRIDSSGVEVVDINRLPAP